MPDMPAELIEILTEFNQKSEPFLEVAVTESLSKFREELAAVRYESRKVHGA